MSINMTTDRHEPRISGASWTQNTLYLIDRGRWVKFENMDDGITTLSTTEIGKTEKANAIAVDGIGNMKLYKDGVEFAVHSLTVNLAELKKRISEGMTENDLKQTNVPVELFAQLRKQHQLRNTKDFEVGDAVKAKFNSSQQGVIEKVLSQSAIYVRLDDGNREKFKKSTLEYQ